MAHEVASLDAEAPGDVFATFRLDGRIAVVTGASSGLGERFTRVLHAAGATVVIGARRLDRLRALVDELGDERLVAVACDVAADDDCERLIATAIEVGRGRLDVLVNNAGIGLPGPAEFEPLSDFRRTIDVNLTAVFVLSQLAGRQMLSQGSGSIVNIASMLGLVAAAPIKHAAYCASKGAVVNLTRELGAQWGRRGVRVNALAPGWFQTEMTDEGIFGEKRSVEFLRRNAPMGRSGEAHELDGALLFLAGDASTYMTGQTLVIDGGWTAR